MESIFFHIDVNSAFLSWTAIDQLQKAKETDTLILMWICVIFPPSLAVILQPDTASY